MTQNSEPFDKAQGRPKTLDSSSGARVVRLKKPHPCGGKEFTIIRESVVVTLKCVTCGSFVRLPREKFENISGDNA